MEDAVSCWVVGLVDGECLQGQVFVFVGIFLLRNENSGSDFTCQPPIPRLCSTSTPLPELCPPPVVPRLRSSLLTMKWLKVTVISCPASVHHLRVCCWGPESSSMCCPAMTCCLQSCWAWDTCGHKGIAVPRGPGAGGPLHATPPEQEGTRGLSSRV